MKHPTHYILTCPTCLRTSFTSLQGLLNHARIAHGIEWGSHDECIRACAVPQGIGEGGEQVNADERSRELNLEDGTEVGTGAGILPGLRSLFQIAVGDDPHSASYHHRLDTGGDEGDERGGGGEGEGGGSGGGHITRTLGLHKDTPALAPFLGRAVRRRGIRVWDDEGSEVDIDEFSDGGENKENWDADVGEDKAEEVAEGHCDSDILMADIPPTHIPHQQTGKRKRVWHMPYAHRNVAKDTDSSSPPIQTLILTERSAMEGTAISNIHTSANTPASTSAAALPASHTPTHSPTRTQPHTQTQIGAAPSPDTNTTISSTGPTAATARSRFHIVARVIVADRSLWVPTGVFSYLPFHFSILSSRFLPFHYILISAHIYSPSQQNDAQASPQPIPTNG